MQQFKDTAGRTWSLVVDVNAIKRVRALLEVDLLEIIQPESDLLRRMYDDEIFLVDLLYVLCKPQLDAAGVSDEQFGSALDGESIDRACAGLLEGLVGFFRDPKKRMILGKALAKISLLEAKAEKGLEKLLESKQLDRKLERKIRQALTSARKGFGEAAGSSAGSPASTPARTPSANS